MLAQSYLEIVNTPILKPKGKIKLLPSSISVIEIRIPEILGSNNINKLDFRTFQLPEGDVLLDMTHHVDHKITRMLKVPISNPNNTTSGLEKNSKMATLVSAGKCEQIQEVK